jgi:hypothetical protein
MKNLSDVKEDGAKKFDEMSLLYINKVECLRSQEEY